MRKNKSINRSLYAALAVGAASTLLSCSDDIHPGIEGEETDVVCFRIDNASWGDAADTRSGAPKGGREIGRAVMRAAGSRDTLCVRAIETDGIDLGSNLSTRGSMVADAAGLASFGCFAYTEQNGQKFFINNEEYSNEGDRFTSSNIYYWPGAQSGLTLDFYCYAPYNAKGLQLPETATATRSLSYVVPDNVADQQDLMIADGDLKGKPGDYKQVMPLTFRHLLSAVRIVAGDNMMAGTVKSISFRNLYSSANINMDAPTAWSGYSDYRSFTYAPDGGVAVTGTANQEIMAGANTMLMLPQDMQPETSLEPTVLTVVFDDGTQERTLEAELTGEWQMGKTYTYRLSITPEYELEFTQDNPDVADAHYSIVPIKIRANELKSGWTITSDQPWATLKSQLTPFEQQGYWLDNSGDYSAYCNSLTPKIPVERTVQITGSNEGEVELYLFLNENTGTSDRSVTLSVRPSDQPNATPSTLVITQKCPHWSGNMGWEQIEEPENENLPYGFKWDRKVTYTQTVSGWTEIPAILEAYVTKWHFAKPGANNWWALDPVTVDYVVVSRSSRTVSVSIDYTKIGDVSNAMDSQLGLENTYNLFTTSGQSAFDGESYLVRNGYTVSSTSGSIDIPSSYAALCTVKKNRFNIQKVESSTGTSYILNITKEDIKWYLPASGQFTALPADMNGKQYWSSTAINDNANAYSWNGSAASTPRMTNLNVRAARVKD